MFELWDTNWIAEDTTNLFRHNREYNVYNINPKKPYIYVKGKRIKLPRKKNIKTQVFLMKEKDYDNPYYNPRELGFKYDPAYNQYFVHPSGKRIKYPRKKGKWDSYEPVVYDEVILDDEEVEQKEEEKIEELEEDNNLLILIIIIMIVTLFLVVIIFVGIFFNRRA